MRAATARPIAPLLQRVAASVLGGYALAVLVSVAASHVLPVPLFDAAMTGVLLSFPVYTAVVCWAFAVRSLRRLWLGLLFVGGACGLLIGVAVLRGVP